MKYLKLIVPLIAITLFTACNSSGKDSETTQKENDTEKKSVSKTISKDMNPCDFFSKNDVEAIFDLKGTSIETNKYVSSACDVNNAEDKTMLTIEFRVDEREGSTYYEENIQRAINDGFKLEAGPFHKETHHSKAIEGVGTSAFITDIKTGILLRFHIDNKIEITIIGSTPVPGHAVYTDGFTISDEELEAKLIEFGKTIVKNL